MPKDHWQTARTNDLIRSGRCVRLGLSKRRKRLLDSFDSWHFFVMAPGTIVTIRKIGTGDWFDYELVYRMMFPWVRHLPESMERESYEIKLRRRNLSQFRIVVDNDGTEPAPF